MDPIEATKIISDEYAIKILVATYRRSKSIIELSNVLSIPIAACYRRVRMLEQKNLIRCVDKILTQKGKRIGVYVSNLKNASIFLEDGQLRVRFELRSGAIENYDGNMNIFTPNPISELT